MSEDSEQISENAWELLQAAAAQVEEGLEEAAQDLARGVEASSTALGDWMPRRFLPRYESVFAERILEEAKALRKGIIEQHESGSPYPAIFLNNVAQEMLMALTIDLAQELDTSQTESDDFETLEFVCFEDRDFELLYDLSRDGVTDDPEVKAQAGFANLEFERWFQPFRELSG